MTKTQISTQTAKKEIELLIRIWLKTHQNEAKAWFEDIENIRRAQFNELATNKKSHKKTTTIRLGVHMPNDLLKTIEKRFPDLFKDREQFRWFMKEFNYFTIPRKI